ncbi:NADP-dependent oxidoreductase domain-containing protein [Endogone sp. FLAS-F59071]|nr:NADP-dependent oxidoreductase domain-containing protein [Endogone sp. FLAS-F59071]|eukprot:RUS21567.1 NADP-dependent oxidoreductase domain-containing protein [Endogone sp. FLAS-F59071]
MYPTDPGFKTLLRSQLEQDHGFANYQGLSRKHIFDSVDASLSHLGLDYIDLYQIHFNKEIPIEKTIEALHDLVKSGKVRYIGEL